nr:hypothetical protein [Amycolatopsis saalfeldensis]
MRKRAFFVAVAAIGAAAVAGPATAATGGPAVSVQLNQDTAGQQTLNKFQRGDDNVALAQCPGAKAGATSFSSPVLTFANYDFGPFIGVEATVSADALLVPGTPAGSYQLTVNCGGKPYSAKFTVPAAQVAKVPAGAAKAGDGSLAE